MQSIVKFLGSSILALVGLAAGCSNERAPASPVDGPGEVFISNVLNSTDHSLDVLDEIIVAADQAAERAAAGGMIYVTDDETIFRTGSEATSYYEGGGHKYPMHEDWGGFVAEACDRAGGLRLIQPVPVEGRLRDLDIVIAGTLDLNPDAQMEQLKSLKLNSGALIIVFGSTQSDLTQVADHFIDNGLGKGTVPVMDVGGKQAIGPVAGIANVINKWVFTAEYVAALTRRGKMPTMYQSMLVSGAARRNQRLGDVMFHPDIRVPAVEPGVLGKQYLDAVKGFLERIKAHQSKNVREAGMLCANTIKSGGEVVASVIGHFMTTQSRMPGHPKIFTVLANQYGKDYLEGLISKETLWLHVGYSFYPLEQIEYVRRNGAKIVAAMCPGPSILGEGLPVELDYNLFDIYIDPYWRYGDGVVQVPGYDIKIIPASGVVMITLYWMILGETMANLNSP